VSDMADGGVHEARAELQAWYLRGLLPKLVQAAKAGAADVGAVGALDAEMRALLEISQEREEAA
jgi:hypothetical protein